MQRKPTPLSHPFHVLLQKMIVLGLIIAWAPSEIEAFHIECPPDITVSCEDELWDLSIYGNALVYGYGDPVSAGPPISTDYNLSSCNVGTIVRTWAAYDYGGNPFYCSQTITVSGSGGDVDIHWPPDYVIHSCTPHTDPDELPPPYDRPAIYGGGGTCSQILTSHQDQVFNINPPACIKILRKWTVVDWCLYDPNSIDPIGIWEHTQIIKITAANAPVIWCPGDTIVSAGSDCTGGYVDLHPAYGSSDCGAGVTITNNSPYAFNHGADASGNYPLGTTKVSFWADDGCGQKSGCSMYVTVKDLKKPTPICYYGISVVLMQMPDGYYLDLRPSFFNKGSFDNCTPKNKLKMWVEPPRVSCEDLGDTPVRLYVEDESGNVEYCNTLVYVHDNIGICPPIDGVIDGVIQSASGDLLNEVKVSLQEATDFSMTNTEGFYAFPALSFGKPYTVSPSRIDDLSGVSAMDMAILLKHILGIEAFSSPYQFIAADIDKSGRVSVNDLLSLKELILRENYGLNPTTSWRFIEAFYSFEHPLDPLSEDFPESYYIPMLSQSMSALDFVGVKLGDINHDAPANIIEAENTLSRSAGIVLYLPKHGFKSGETFEMPVFVDSYDDLQAMQFALNVDDEMIEVVSARPSQNNQGLDIINSTNEHHIVSGLWYGVQTLTAPQLFTITFHALKNGSLQEALSLTSAQSLAYKKNVTIPYSMELQFIDDANAADIHENLEAKGLKLTQNYPNPFHDVTTISIELAEAGLLEISIYDLNGRILYVSDQAGVQGLQEIVLKGSDLGVHGVVVARVIFGRESATIRMVVLQPGS